MTEALRFERVVTASPARVFAAWTTAAQLEQWWGPEGFRTHVVALDLRVGGAWQYVMRGPDGTEYPSHATYVVVERPHRLVFDNVGGRVDDPHLSCRMHVDFEALGPKRTRVQLCMQFASADALHHAVAQGAESGGEQSLRRLAARWPASQ